MSARLGLIMPFLSRSQRLAPTPTNNSDKSKVFFEVRIGSFYGPYRLHIITTINELPYRDRTRADHCVTEQYAREEAGMRRKKKKKTLSHRHWHWHTGW